MDFPIERYLNAVFDHDEAGGDWYWSDPSPANQEPLAQLWQDNGFIVDVLWHAFSNFDRYLARFTPWQVATGINYAFNGSMSNFAFATNYPGRTLERRVEMVRGLRTIFDRVFAVHCLPVLSHRATAPRPVINRICYMFWDETPLMSVLLPSIRQACLDVMEHCLASKNVAVVESALHGLGHNVRVHGRAGALIDAYIGSTLDKSADLLTYARAARTDAIQ